MAAIMKRVPAICGTLIAVEIGLFFPTDNLFADTDSQTTSTVSTLAPAEESVSRAHALSLDNKSTAKIVSIAGSTVIQLGKIDVNEQKVLIQALQIIKKALSEPISNDPKKANDIICQITSPTGTHLEYLECSTNRQLSELRRETQLSMLTSLYDMRNYKVERTDWRFKHPINGAALKELLKKIPDEPSESNIP